MKNADATQKVDQKPTPKLFSTGLPVIAMAESCIATCCATNSKQGFTTGGPAAEQRTVYIRSDNYHISHSKLRAAPRCG